MKSKKFLSTLLSLTAMLFLSVLATTQAQAQTPPTRYSGQARGIRATTSLLGQLELTATAGNTGAFDTTGNFSNNVNLLNASIDFGTSIPPADNSVQADVITLMTSGGPATGTSQSSATVMGLDFALLAIGPPVTSGVTITAKTVASTPFANVQILDRVARALPR